MTASLGGFEIVSAAWIGNTALAVTVETALTDRYLQLYAGRRLIGVTSSIGQLTVIGQLQPAHCPHCLTVVLCEEGDQATDFGASLPAVPFNQFQMAWQADSFPADSKWFELTAATAAGGAVDTDTIVAKIAYEGDGEYSFIFPPVTEYGDWTYRVTPIDDAEPDGNAGTPAEVTLSTIPYPPDVLLNSDGSRLAASVNAGTLTVDFDFDW